MGKRYQGTGVSRGIAIGYAYKYVPGEIKIRSYNITEQQIDKELARYREAKEKVRDLIIEVKKKAAGKLKAEELGIFDAHLAMLNDPLLDEEIINILQQEKVNIEFAVKKGIKNIINRFLALDNEYFRERTQDIADVGNQVLQALTGQIKSLHHLQTNTIIVAEDLTPSETVLLDKEKVIGFVLSKGGKTSHTTVMARSMMIPTIIGLEGILDEVEDGQKLIIDGESGKLILEPGFEDLKEYQEKQTRYRQRQQQLKELIDKEAVTSDGFKVKLACNIGMVEEVNAALKLKADGIGLFRTEFLYMGSKHLPDEECQYKAYKQVVSQMGGKPVIIRTLDFGGDKNIPYLDIPEEMNPFLGWRAIRISLEEKAIFKTQLRAILRASSYGKVKIMFPLISSLDELLQAKEILEEVKGDLEARGESYDAGIEVGMMIEVPSAAVLADTFAPEVDFFSIGTNDLIQYTLAVDRGNEKMAHLYTPYHPAVLRLIKNVADVASSFGIGVSICGETGADLLLTPVFLGMGINELSMQAASLLEVKKRVRSISKATAVKIAAEVLAMTTAKEIEEYLQTLVS